MFDLAGTVEIPGKHCNLRGRFFVCDVIPKSAMLGLAIISVDHLAEEPYASAICYPQATPDEMRSRMEELKMLGVEAVEFSGRILASSMNVLGKGHVGVVTAAHTQNGRLALKMLRADSGRESLEHEAPMLAKANTVGAGPRLAAATKHFLLMQLIDGGPLEEWLASDRDTADVRRVLTEILEQCWRLDGIGLDHGGLVRAPKHILVDSSGAPFLVDFETASVLRNASNVTSVCHFLFLGESDVRTKLTGLIGERDGPELTAALRNYRKSRTRQSFEELLELCLSDR
jgi:putative serine/threonine protein kinase